MKTMLMLLLISANSFANSPSLSSVRAALQSSARDEKSCRQLIKMLDSYNEKNIPLLGGYKAAATMMLAKYVFNPFSKLSSFLKGKSLLEKCIAADKQNIELRFLRYCIQSKAPAFLQYRSSLKEDEDFLSGTLVLVKDAELKKMIAGFLNSEVQ